MPYKNEYAARINQPGKYKAIRRQNNKFGNGIDALFGIKKDGKTELQAIRFRTGRFKNMKQVKEWLKKHGHKPIKVESPVKESLFDEKFDILMEELFNESKIYTNIAHDNPESVIWILNNGTIETAKMDDGLDHEDLWKDIFSKSYRGRFDPATKEVSVVPPDFKHHIHSSIIEKLKEKFGSDIKIIEFGGETYQYNPVID